MDLHVVDRRITDTDTFPEHVTAFPASTDLLFEHPTPVTSPLPEINDIPYFPPQKLRPKRSNGRNHVRISNSSMDAQPKDLLEDGEFLVNDILRAASAAPGLGFPDNYLGTELWTAGATSTMADTPILEPSSSSDYGGTGMENISSNRKRKRKTKKKLKMFLENLAAKVLQNQEQMHCQLIQIIEEKEKERISREEAWKQQEMERAKREEHVRAQETSRNLAIISFIENFLGGELQCPKSLQTSCDEGEVQNQSKVMKHDQNDEKSTKFESEEVQTGYDLFRKRWPKSEVEALIAVRTGLDYKFNNLGSSKGPSLWEEISVGLASMGFNRTAKKCKEKWENMNKYFKKTMDGGKPRPENVNSCPYFRELELLYNAGLKYPANGVNSRNDESEEKRETA